MTSEYYGHIAVTSRSKATEWGRAGALAFHCALPSPSRGFAKSRQLLPFLASFSLLSFPHKPHLFVARREGWGTVQMKNCVFSFTFSVSTLPTCLNYQNHAPSLGEAMVLKSSSVLPLALPGPWSIWIEVSGSRSQSSVGY